jgi:hypothetical protein
MRHLWLAWAAAGILAASPASAQDVSLPGFEIGGNFSGLIRIVFEDGPAGAAGGGPRISLNVSPRLSIDLLAEVIGPVESPGTLALYQSQLKFPVRKSREGQRTLSLTIGATGLAWYRRSREQRVGRLDGSIVVYPGYRRFRVTAPNTLCIGLAREQVFSRHASSSLALQGYFGAVGGLAVRASVGVAFGIGGYR